MCPRNYGLSDILVWVRMPNPKQPGSKSAARFDRYLQGENVTTQIARGLKAEDIDHDLKRSYIRLRSADADGR